MKGIKLFLLISVGLFCSLSVKAQVPPNPNFSTATVVNTFPYLDANVNTSLGGSNLGMQGGCIAACCSTVVYRVECPPVPGTLRGDMNPFTPLAGSMLAYSPLVPNPTADSDLIFAPGPGNFCGFRDSIQIGNLSGGEILYVYVFTYNSQTTQGANSDITFDYWPDCPPGFNCGSLSETICDNMPYLAPSGQVYTTSGSYQDTIPGAAVGGLDSLIYLSLNYEVTQETQNLILDETVCDTVFQVAETPWVGFAHFDPSERDFVNVDAVAPALAGTNRSAFMWIKQSTTVSGSSQTLLGINTGSGGNICNLQIGTNEQLGVFDGGTARYTGVTVTDGQWHFVGYTYDETTDSTKIYVDGVMEREFRNSQSATGTSVYSLGQEYDSGLSTGNFFEGEMTEVSIWNEVLDSVEIDLIMRKVIKPTHPKYTNLQGYYPMLVSCSAARDSVVDFSPNNNNGIASASGIIDPLDLDSIGIFNAVCHYNVEWERGGSTLSTADTLVSTPAVADVHSLTLTRDYAEISDSWVVSLQTGCGVICADTNVTINPTVCDSYTVPSGTATYTTSGTIMDTLSRGKGCDSILTINLVVNHSVTTTSNLTACDSAVINGTTYASTQVVTDIFPGGSANGCDSTHVTNLTINPSVTTTSNLTACDSAVINGTTYASSQVVTDVFPGGSANGCDSTHITNLTINSSVTTTSNLTACDSAVINGTTYTTTQMVTDVFPGGSANGCDSTHITNLTINPSVTTTSSLTACDSAVINGTTYTSSQMVTDVFPGGSANGCDSTHITNLTINPSVTTTSNLTACDSAVINGTTYTTSQVVTDVFPGGCANGCDSTHITNLTINPSVTTTSNLTACDSAVINGTTYTTTQVVTDVFPGGSSNGCDSTHITNLTINHSVTTTSNLTACDTAVINGTTYTTSQVVTDVFPGGSANGCDSTHITNLTINPSVTTTSNLTACDSAVINGTTYTSSQMVTDVFPGGSANGCDSTHITNLTINPSVTTTSNLTACDSTVINGTTYTTSQVVTDIFPGGSANGCDSTHVINLTINSSVTTTSNLTACDSAVINGTTYTTTQVVTDLFPGGSANGCDSTHVTNLTINPSVTTTSNLTACDSAVINGTTYTTTQVVTDVFPGGSTNGCDSTHITNLTINSSVTTTSNLTACDSAVINGTTYTTTQMVTDVFPGGSANGCDSTHITDLTINPSVTTTSNLTACDSAVINGTTYTSSQVVTDVFPGGSANGCDSTHITNLTINSSVTTTSSLTACDSAVINGTTYTTTQVVTDVFPGGSTNGCDSTHVTNLTINPSVTTTSNLTACDSAVINGTTYTTSQVVTDVFPGGSANGCDSTQITNLTINFSVTTTSNLTACDSAVINGTTYTTTQVVTDVFPGGSANGCDSTHITNLTINNGNSFTQSVTICNGDTLYINGNAYFASGTYTDTLLNSAGCDSILTTQLAVNGAINTMVTVSGSNLFAVNANATYQWYTCINNAPGTLLSGEVSQTYSPTINGDYLVELMENGCTAFSDCYSFMTGLEDEVSLFEKEIKIYPNPTSGQIVIKFPFPQNKTGIRVYDQIGQIVLSRELSGLEASIDLSGRTAGGYFVIISSRQGTVRHKILLLK